ncbi:MAG: Smr/MutS family protein [Pseudomonadota bacterium]
MARRKLTAEEIDLWRKVVHQTERLHADGDATLGPLPKPKPKPKKPLVQRVAATSKPEIPGSSQSLSKPAQTTKPKDHPLRMDRKAFGRMTRGKTRPEARLDLHGHRLESAHPALIRFVLSQQASGKRLLLIITGKGKEHDENGPIPTRRGVLKHQVPVWLKQPPLAHLILQVTPAHVSHGGDGAFYVYLRRAR